jgi:hypothetical protein
LDPGEIMSRALYSIYVASYFLVELLTVAVCVWFALRRRSAASWWLVVGRTGAMLVGPTALALLLYVVPRLGDYAGSGPFLWVTRTQGVVTVAFNLVFAVALALVLREAVENWRGPSEQAPQPDAPEGGAR